jgi:hypothetical protein
MALGICQRVTLVVVGKCRVARSQHIVRRIIGAVGSGYADNLPLRSIPAALGGKVIFIRHVGIIVVVSGAVFADEVV